VQTLEFGAGLDTHDMAQPRRDRAVDRKGLARTAEMVEGPHQESGRVLIERIGAVQLDQFAQQLRAALPQLQLQFDARQFHRPALLLQPGPRRLGPLPGRALERLADPQRLGLAQQRHGPPRLLRARRGAGLRHQCVKPVRVHRVGSRVEPVAARAAALDQADIIAG
jgi:hypothetical protein